MVADAAIVRPMAEANREPARGFGVGASKDVRPAVGKVPVDFEVREAVQGGVVVVAVHGELDLDTAGALRRRLDSRDGQASAAVIDLSECAFIDSTGISLLVRAFRRAENDGGAGLVLIATPGSQVRKTLRLTNIDSNIPVLGSLEAALGTVDGAAQDGASRKTSTE